MEDIDWQRGKGRNECFTYMLDKEVLCDTEFQVGEEEELIKAHKLILACRSPVFEKMFFGSLPETTSPIVIPDVEPTAFKAMLRYCYNEDLDVAPKLALSTMYAAKKYLLPILEEACRGIQIKNLSAKDIWKTYTAGLTYSDDVLTKACRCYFQDSITKVADALKPPDFLTIPETTLLDFLKINNRKDEKGKVLPGIFIADIELFEACNAWAGEECLRQELDPSGENKRKVLGEGLFDLRFPDMLPADVANIVSPTGILTLEERVDLLETAAGAKKSLMRFPSSNYLTLLVCNISQSSNQTQEHSMTTGKKAFFSTVEIEPQQRLLLTGVLTPISMGKCEVLINNLQNESEISYKQIDHDIAVNSANNRFRHLSFKQHHVIQAGSRYCIKVASLKPLESEENVQRKNFFIKTFI